MYDQLLNKKANILNIFTTDIITDILHIFVYMLVWI